MPRSPEKIILDLCAGSGEWSRPYHEAGYKVIRVDAKQMQDVRLFHKPKVRIQGILAAPPCTAFAVSGNQIKRTYQEYIEALSIVDACLRIVFVSKPQWWALENPVGTLHRWIGKPKMYFNPCDYGDPYTKKTGLWGEFNAPEKNPVEPVRVCSQGSWIQKLGGKSAKTKALRAVTPPHFAMKFFEANP